ncbi:MAG: PA14 domain-containing protein, partial [Leadbetterella sp.]
FITVSTDGVYQFYTNSNDGSKLYIGNTLVVSNDGVHTAQERSGKIGLKAGTHAITVDYFDALTDNTLSVSYQGPSLTKRAIPNSALKRFPDSFDTTDPRDGTIAARGETSPNVAGLVFDNVYTNSWNNTINSTGTNGALPTWVEYRYKTGDKYNVTSFTIMSNADNANKDPRKIELYGIKDDNTLQLLHTVNNTNFTARNQRKSNTVTNTTGYKGYRLVVVTLVGTSQTNAQVGEIEFIGTRTQGSARLSFEENTESISSRNYFMPNPTESKETTLVYNSLQDDVISIEAYNMLGVLNKSQTSRVNQGINYIPVNLKNQSSGTYLIKTKTTRGTIETFKIILK